MDRIPRRRESRLPGEGASEGYGYHPPKNATHPPGPDDSRYPVGGLPARPEPRDYRYLGESHDGRLFLSWAHLDLAESLPVLRSSEPSRGATGRCGCASRKNVSRFGHTDSG